MQKLEQQKSPNLSLEERAIRNIIDVSKNMTKEERIDFLRDLERIRQSLLFDVGY